MYDNIFMDHFYKPYKTLQTYECAEYNLGKYSGKLNCLFLTCVPLVLLIAIRDPSFPALLYHCIVLLELTATQYIVRFDPILTGESSDIAISIDEPSTPNPNTAANIQ